MMLGLLTHDERQEHLAHAFGTAGFCIAISEALKVDIEGHEPTISRSAAHPRTHMPRW